MNSFQTCSISEALDEIKSGSRVVSAMAASEPQILFENLAKHAAHRSNITLFCANPSKDYECFADDHALDGKLSLLVMFLTAKIRHQQGQGRVHYIPQHLSQWVSNITRSGTIDVFWGSCSVPDKRGFVSLGPSSCYESEIYRSAKVRVLEINPSIPITFGSTTVSIDTVDFFVNSDRPLPAVRRPIPDADDTKIGEFIAELVPDEATLQLGIGGIPNAVADLIKGKKDLGIHTEMINDAIMDLHIAGAITNLKKKIWPGKILGSFIYGSEELYEYVDRNPAFELQPSSVVNDPYKIGKNCKMISINTAVEVDLTGQVCSESIGHLELSGVGGASETHIGAQRSQGGRGIIALKSKTKSGRSKIVFELQPGAKVSISRNDIDTLITEYGIAELKGKSVAARVREIVKLAHPEFREELLSKARHYNYL